jgi:hypothetical protein
MKGTSISHNLDRFFNHIRHSVERWNDRAVKAGRSDWENYVNGDIDLFFEFTGVRNSGIASSVAKHRRHGPDNVPTRLTYVRADQATKGKVGDLSQQNLAGKPGVICRWNQQHVLVDDIEAMDHIEICVPARFAVGFKFPKRLNKNVRYSTCQSVRYGFVKPLCRSTEWKLNSVALPVILDELRNNIPIGVIQRGPEIMDSVPTDKRRKFNNGFVLFGIGGAVAGVCISFEDIRERSLFTEQCVQFVDVFRGPLDFKGWSVSHFEESQLAVA